MRYCDLTCPRGQWAKWYYVWVPPVLNHHPAGPMSVFVLTNRLKRPFQLQPQVGTSKLELQKEP